MNKLNDLSSLNEVEMDRKYRYRALLLIGISIVSYPLFKDLFSIVIVSVINQIGLSSIILHVSSDCCLSLIRPTSSIVT